MNPGGTASVPELEAEAVAMLGVQFAGGTVGTEIPSLVEPGAKAVTIGTLGFEDALERFKAAKFGDIGSDSEESKAS